MPIVIYDLIGPKSIRRSTSDIDTETDMLVRIIRKLARGFDRLRAYPIGPTEPFPGLARLPTRVRSLAADLSFNGTAGWLSPNERRALYALAYWRDGPFLEIGSWVGLSTSCIALGIRDSKRSIHFLSNDLSPSVNNFKPHKGAIGLFIPSDSSDCMATTSVEDYESNLRPILEAPGGIMGCLKCNLARNGLADLIEIAEGDFRVAVPRMSYPFVFCDCVHSPEEIQANVPSMLPLMSPDCIVAFHDTNAANERVIRSLVTIRESCQIDSLFLARVK